MLTHSYWAEEEFYKYDTAFPHEFWDQFIYATLNSQNSFYRKRLKRVAKEQIGRSC